MDTDYQFQPISHKRNTSIHQPLPQFSTAGTDESEQQTLDLAWLLSVVRRRIAVMAGVAIALSAITGGLIVISSKQIIKEYQGNFRVLVEPVTAEGRLARLMLQAQSVNEGVADLSRIGSSVEESSMVDYQTLIRVLKSPEIMGPLVKKLQEKFPGITYKTLASRLEISRLTYLRDGKQAGTKILQFTYQDERPERIRPILEAVANYYLDYSREERLTSIQQGIDFIDKQLPEVRQRVDRLQKELQILRKQANITTPEMMSRNLAERVSSVQIRRLDIQAQLAEMRTYYENLKKQLAAGETSWMMAINPKAYETFVGQLSAIESQIAIESAQFREDSVPIQSLREKQQNLRQLLRQQAETALDNIAGQIRQLEARERSLAETENNLNQQIRNLPAFMRRYDDLQRELEVATDSLKLFLEKREALQLGAAQQQVNWQVIAKPDLVRDATGAPMSVTVKQTSRHLAIAIILSTLLGIGVGFLVEVLNTVFHTPEEVKAATKLPIIGVIPFAKSFQKTTPASETSSLTLRPSSHTLVLGTATKAQQSSDSTVLEAFRSLYTNIRLLSPQTPIRSLAISSASPGDGKSTVAFHLAQTAAAIGQRVLLVDADLRSPHLHQRFGLPNVRGLSDAISSDIGLNDIIQRAGGVWSEELPGEDNLFVLTAGSLFPDPIKLLSSKKMLYLMEQFQAFFDLVIYDTPALVGLADGNIIGSHTDGVVMVVGLDKTDRALVMKALDSLKISGASVLGIVANGIKGYKPKSDASYQRT
ncbi:MAG: polysaccharide biosynthesis tyrosine autokinase [Oscillatoriaceae bacterium SKW80]|nr:polysaccharide biosynthesis tyrosine autokinase [Oscillatoriaceae bacterium SKYG93]MCX8119939.1 polysaccharide biosynthesis tyrosine autokinase [Oscillatoriaceae bacterium SKW80]MDW8454099.1 polysaccharide biosynthesis tyrosine autokinase [Oscillatoriaceae cyanobacterium SKYGB_i_bin93]HIK29585.1 polysaccharide biosynthesis tyrosine autokinase [Oscillatoriaceae cyanobacterium M7585_C2015_266]